MKRLFAIVLLCLAVWPATAQTNRAVSTLPTNTAPAKLLAVTSGGASVQIPLATIYATASNTAAGMSGGTSATATNLVFVDDFRDTTTSNLWLHPGWTLTPAGTSDTNKVYTLNGFLRFTAEADNYMNFYCVRSNSQPVTRIDVTTTNWLRQTGSRWSGQRTTLQVATTKSLSTGSRLHVTFGPYNVEFTTYTNGTGVWTYSPHGLYTLAHTAGASWTNGLGTVGIRKLNADTWLAYRTGEHGYFEWLYQCDALTNLATASVAWVQMNNTQASSTPGDWATDCAWQKIRVGCEAVAEVPFFSRFNYNSGTWPFLATNVVFSGSQNLFRGVEFLVHTNDASVFKLGLAAGRDYAAPVSGGDGWQYPPTFIGWNAGRGATNSHASVFVGNESGLASYASPYATFVGTFAGHESTNAYNSTMIGYAAGQLASNAYAATFVGCDAGRYHTNQHYSTVVGAGIHSPHFTGPVEATNRSAEINYGFPARFNSLFGFGSGALLLGDRNTFLGAFSGSGETGTAWEQGSTNDSLCTFIGFAASRDATAPAVTNSIAIGARAKTTKSNQAVIGTDSTTELKTYGAVLANSLATSGASGISTTGGSITSGQNMSTVAAGYLGWTSRTLLYSPAADVISFGANSANNAQLARSGKGFLIRGGDSAGTVDNFVAVAGSVIASNQLFLPAVAYPTQISGAGCLWNSNSALYWVTATKTNLVSDGR